MSSSIVGLVYLGAVIVALALVYWFGNVRWYWHVLALAAAVALALIPMELPGGRSGPKWDLVFGGAVVFLLVWGAGEFAWRGLHLPHHQPHKRG